MAFVNRSARHAVGAFARLARLSVGMAGWDAATLDHATALADALAAMAGLRGDPHDRR